MTNASSKWHVYILQCVDDTYYTGVTTDVERRVKEHNAGTASKYTRVRVPVFLLYTESAPSQSKAQSREAEIKRLSRQEKKKLISLSGSQ